ncbi:MAG: hypothetical protein DRJ40_05625 [Thermoprotei archaeon]|nr:MAG: hypothetical protein DRJ40_05625 [Thermoprotei archaeon]
MRWYLLEVLLLITVLIPATYLPLYIPSSKVEELVNECAIAHAVSKYVPDVVVDVVLGNYSTSQLISVSSTDHALILVSTEVCSNATLLVPVLDEEGRVLYVQIIKK